VIDWLLGTLIATTALTALVLLIREPVRKHFGARVAYSLWLIPAARLLMPTITQTVERTVPATTPIQPFVPIMVSEPKLLASVAPEPTLIEQMGGLQTILLVLWLGVGIGLFIARMMAFRRERAAILRDSVQLATIGSIRMVRSSAVTGPLAFGIFDRVIAVPANFDRIYADHERRLALDHELAHHRSGDLVANLFAFVLLCLQWFNPLAWVAHAAFRFDQEAACDARVLDKAKVFDRADYGRAIAKAASGRALLFASALDRRKTLHRRLKSMLTNPTAGRRLAGRLTVLAAVAIALPLTATRAVEYIDKVAPPTPAAPAVAAAPATPVALAALAAQPAPVAPVAPVAPLAPATPEARAYEQSIAPVASLDAIDTGHRTVIIDGKRKTWKELKPEEKARIRASIAEARRGLAESRVDREKMRREIRQAMAEVRANRGEWHRDMAEARADEARAMADIDAHAIEIRRSGQDPERIKASVRASLKSIEKIDFDKIERDALNSVDEAQIEASVEAAERAMEKAQEELDRLNDLDDLDDDES
jgi:beta-lactamase regulating signal transducer with metallopeptidase domain